ncbi:MAG: recombinase RarA, partial [Treponema sp.]|nr:recombinase RarA [Treponema sp.]
FSELPVQRYDRILVCNADEGMLLWEALRRAPEGLAAGLVQSQQSLQTLLHFAKQSMTTLEEEELPRLMVLADQDIPERSDAEEYLSSGTFEYILARDLFRRPLPSKTISDRITSFSQRARSLLVPGGRLALIGSPPRRGMRIASLIEEEIPRLENIESETIKDLIHSLKEAEAVFWDQYKSAWELEDLESALRSAGFETKSNIIKRSEERLISTSDINSWFDTEKSSWGKSMANQLGAERLGAIRDLMYSLAKQGPLTWKWEAVLIHATAV